MKLIFMKLFLILFTLFNFLSCRMNDKNKAIEEKVTFPIESKGISPIIIKSDRKIFANISVTPYSVDSIIVNIIFTNKSGSEYYLYKPMVPSNKSILDLAVFHLATDKNYEDVSLNRTYLKKGYEFYSGIDTVLPAIKPILKEDMFIKINKDQEFATSFNIAKSYNFHPFIKRKINKFSIAYLALMPRVINLIHVHEIDTKDKLYKPVFDDIEPEGSNNLVLKKIHFTIPMQKN